MTEGPCYRNRTNSLRQTAKKTRSGVTEGGAKRRLQANSEAKRNLIGWADNSQTERGIDEEVQSRKSLSRVYNYVPPSSQYKYLFKNNSVEKGLFLLSPTVHLLVFDHAILFESQIFVVLVFILLGCQVFMILVFLV
ncbi:hypothetical protein T09_1273 [Trichinella sp. T9]|nr:hypothetical protein T09_1273 [Trichinella sp. T9]